MAIVKAVHSIVHSVTIDGESERKVQPAGSIFAIDDSHLSHLNKAGAIEAPTEDELKLYHLANPAPVEVSQPAPSAPLTAAQKKAAAKAAADAAKAAGDPEPDAIG